MILVAGAGGFIGGHLAKSLLADGHRVKCVDIKPLEKWWQVHEEASNCPYVDLKDPANCEEAVKNVDQIYMLAADMGGMGFIEFHKTECMLSVLASTNMLLAAKNNGIEKYFYSSSACVYAAQHQNKTDVTALKESDAYPAEAEDGYGWEKLFTERMCRHFREDFGLETRVARFHNVYGPAGSWNDIRAKAPAALCRKVIEAGPNGDMEVWGDGHQTRSFMYIDDCVKGTKDIMDSDILYPINLGSSELVSVNQLIDIIEDIAGYKVNRKYDLTKPQGVRGRNSDNELIVKELDWEPNITLREGLEKTFAWIYQQTNTIVVI